jgi:hypothetical protein
MPGTVVVGNGFNIEVASQSAEISFLGTRNRHIEIDDLHLSGAGHLGMDFVKMTGGSLLAPSGSNGMSFDISNSSFSEISEYVYAWYPNSHSSITGSSFDGLRFSVSGGLTITDNVFMNYDGNVASPNYDVASIMTAWNGITDFSDNTILNSSGQLLEVKYTSSLIEGSGNYFEGIAPGNIGNHLWDNRDDLNNPSAIEIGAVSKSQSDNLFYQKGSAGADLMHGTSMEDTIDGKKGADVLKGMGGNDLIMGGSGSDFIFGAGGDDRLIGGGQRDELFGGRGKDNISAGGADDLINGGKGKDILTGGSGADTFVFDKLSDSHAASSKADVIKDFKHGVDHIDLRSIDASSEISGNNAFTFDGTTQFGTSKSGEIYYSQFDMVGTDRDYTMVYIDNDSDRGVEMSIRLDGLVNLSAGDFFL